MTELTHKEQRKRDVYLADKRRVAKNRAAGLVKIYGYWIHKTQRERVLYFINELMYSEDFTKKYVTPEFDWDISELMREEKLLLAEEARAKAIIKEAKAKSVEKSKVRSMFN